jgi:hypothetical protein
MQISTFLKHQVGLLGRAILERIAIAAQAPPVRWPPLTERQGPVKGGGMKESEIAQSALRLL